MTSTIRNEPLHYRNEPFAIHHLIADCPPFTVIRELMKNAEENASQLQPAGMIEWFTEAVNGVPKLGLFNEGPGMSGEDLAQLMDLASTAKTLGIDNNFGQGGKISALKVSPHGVVYRSCKAGIVCQIILAAEQRPGCDFPVYVKRRQYVRDDERDSWEVVIDVTAAFAERPDRPLDRDWTEVVLLGTGAEHDTVHELLAGLGKNWLMKLINTRFFRLAEGVAIRNANVSTGARDSRHAYGLEEKTQNHSEKIEDVPATHPRFGPVTIRYCKLTGSYGTEDSAATSRAKTMEAYGIGTRGDHVCLVWKNECYDVHTGWSRISGPFGVMFGSSNVAIQILLPDVAPVKNNTYRDLLIERTGDHQLVRVEEFAELVRQHRPAWFIEYIEQEARKNTNHTSVMERLKAFLEQIKAVGDLRPCLEPEGDQQGEMPGRAPGNGRGTGQGGGNKDFDAASPHHRPAQGKRLPSQRAGIPQVEFTMDPGHLEELQGRAALYRRAANLILLNPHHFKYQADLEKLYADAGPDAERRRLARHLFDTEYCFNAGKFVVLAWLFKGQADWDDHDWEESLSKGALTIHLAEPASLAEARRLFHQRLNSRKTAALESGHDGTA